MNGLKMPFYPYSFLKDFILHSFEDALFSFNEEFITKSHLDGLKVFRSVVH